MYKNLIAALAALLACWLPAGVHANPPAAGSPQPLEVGFLYVAPLTDMGWVRQHDQGRLAIEKTFNLPGQTPKIKTRYIENLPEGPDAERVLRQWAREGVKLIFAPSFGYMEPVMQVASEFPEVRFESITGYKRAANVATANARYYEGRYLAGVAAAKVSPSGVAGYVAGFPIPEVLQGINAFTLGMRSVNPKAEVRVIWLQAWFDPAREREAAMRLLDQGAEVLAFHTGSTAVMTAAQSRGAWAVAYHSDMRRIAPDAQLLAIEHDWRAYDVSRVKALLAGQWQSGDVWGGLREGMIRVGDFGHRVPESVRREVNRQAQAIRQGRLSVFVGPLKDRQGKFHLPAGQVASDAHILNMNYLVPGVIGALP